MTLSLEELEKLALFMGWERHEHMVCPETHHWWIVSGTWEDAENSELMLSSDWKPDQDRNQTALLLEKVGEKKLKHFLINQLHHQLDPTVGDKGGYTYNGVWIFMTAPPEVICRAILEIIGEKPE